MEGLVALLPYALLLVLCPLMMLLMHRGGSEHDHQMNDREELARQLRATRDEVRT